MDMNGCDIYRYLICHDCHDISQIIMEHFKQIPGCPLPVSPESFKATAGSGPCIAILSGASLGSHDTEADYMA